MIWHIARRELLTRGRSKGFIISTAIMFLGVIGGALAISLLTGGDEAQTVSVGVLGDGVSYAEALDADTDDLIVDVETFSALDAAEEAVDAGDVDVAFDGTSLIWKGFPSTTVETHVRNAVQQVEFTNRANDLGLSPSDVGQLFTPLELEERRLDGGENDFGVRAIVAGVSGLATFMLLQIWGAFMLLGVIEEKQSRVVEVLLSHVRPTTLLAGKMLGLGILAAVQMLILVAGITLGLTLVDDIEIPDGVWSTVPLFAVIFVLGFAFYATAFGAVGSMVSRQEDAQSAQLPVMLPLFVGYGVAASSFGNADNLVVRIMSLIPFTSPVVMPFRHAFTNVPLWEILLCLAILAASTVVMVRIAGGIYRYSLLRIGSRVGWKEALRGGRAG